jgi:uracil-DNA glycosylase
MLRCLIVGEAWGENEETAGAPFVGASGIELNEELEDAGWLRPGAARAINSRLYQANRGGLSWDQAVRYRDSEYSRSGLALTNCVSARPPGNKIEAFFHTLTEGRRLGLAPVNGRMPNALLREGIERLTDLVRRTRPALVLCLGGTPLWALSGHDGITRWRGSQLRCLGDQPLACTLHPAAVLREWPWRPIVVHDLRRALHECDNPTHNPEWDFLVRPTRDQVLDYLDRLGSADGPLVSDTETTGGHIVCIGFADSARRAICIPFLDPGSADGNYWRSAEDEWAVIRAIRHVLQTRPIVFHNGLYDMQVIRQDWGFWPNWTDDTMIAQHVAFPGMLGAGIDPVTGTTSKKGSSLALSFLASMYCSHYSFWKDDGRLWDPSTTDVDSYWRYNCEDCARTFECHTALQGILGSAGLLEQYIFQCAELGPATLRMMSRGLRCDVEERARMLHSVKDELHKLDDWFERVLGHPLNPQSSPQMRKLFYDDLRAPTQWKGRGETRALSCDDEALEKIAGLRPAFRPLTNAISSHRTLSVLGGKATRASKSILTCNLSSDHRLRTTLNLCGAETFRYASGPTAQGEGCNLQNILKVKE